MIVFVNQMLLMRAGDVERNPGPGKRGRIFKYWRGMQCIWRALSVHVKCELLCVSVSYRIQWNLQRKDTLGTALLSFLRRLFLSQRFMKFYNLGWNISNVVKFVHELVCKIVK